MERIVRAEEDLKIKIGEVKDVPNSASKNSNHDIFCTIALDQQEICRTSYAVRNNSIHFCEEYFHKIINPFRFLSIYVWDFNKKTKLSTPVGKVVIKRQELSNYNDRDHWFSIHSVSPNSEVQGSVAIEMQYQNENKTQIQIAVKEAKNLSRKNGKCNPFATIEAIYSDGSVFTRKSKSVTSTDNPKFEGCCFQFDTSINKEIMHTDNEPIMLVAFKVRIWHNTRKSTDGIFLGEVMIRSRNMEQLISIRPLNWFLLQPIPTVENLTPNGAVTLATPPGTRLSTRANTLGSVRIKLMYSVNNVFPLVNYENLMNVILQIPRDRPIETSVIYLLGHIFPAHRTEIAKSLVPLFAYNECLIDVIKYLADYELSILNDTTTVFRDNTLLSKLMDESMRLFGSQYLYETLQPIITIIIKEKKPCEIDPNKVDRMNAINKNLRNLEDYIERVLTAIVNSGERCPNILKRIFATLIDCESSRGMRYSIVSSFILLRFFVPAILGPKLFDLTTEKLDYQTSRTLTLISKMIQSIWNCVCATTGQQLCKEQYTQPLFQRFGTEQYLRSVRLFLDTVSTCPNNSNKDEIIVFKKGTLFKQKTNRNTSMLYFGKKYSKRHFQFNTNELRYSKAHCDELTHSIPLSSIKSVRLLNLNLKKSNVIEIIHDNNHGLYVRAANRINENEWFYYLNKIADCNVEHLGMRHPSLYRDGKWECCSNFDLTSPGCRQVVSNSLNYTKILFDPANHLQRIYSLIQQNLDTFHQIMWTTQDLIVRKNIQNLLIGTSELFEQQYRYRTLLMRKHQIGSPEYPIGDDNYMNLRSVTFPGNMSSNPIHCIINYDPQNTRI